MQRLKLRELKTPAQDDSQLGFTLPRGWDQDEDKQECLPGQDQPWGRQGELGPHTWTPLGSTDSTLVNSLTM